MDVVVYAPPIVLLTYPSEDHWPNVVTANNQPITMEPVKTCNRMNILVASKDLEY